MSFPDVPPYPPEVLDLLSPEGFDRQFWALYASADWRSMEACYEVLEARREHYFHRRYYSEYSSFRTARNNRLRRQKRNKVS
jgi:hypothetical protein